MTGESATNGWGLEVVRGRDPGRVYALDRPQVVLGNAVGIDVGIDLAEQEGVSPRRMAARQARIDLTGQGPRLLDLDSPGGTFVNKQRLQPGQGRPLARGDVIQLGSVQLRVVAGNGHSSPPPLPARPATAEGRPGAAPSFTLKSGPTCRSWDDFLTIAAQRWADLRDELTSGRLAGGLAASGHTALAPHPDAPGTPDERLDAWLASLPTTRPSVPELDVHPAALAIKVASGGGTTRRKLRVGNTGYRLLRGTARVEPGTTAWLKVAPELAGKPFLAVEEIDLPLDVLVPEDLSKPLSATVVVESNGGTRQVRVTLDRAAESAVPEPGRRVMAVRDWGIRARLARVAPRTRIVAGAIAGALVRLAIGITQWAIVSPEVSAPGLRGPALLFALLGGVAGFLLARRRGTWADAPAGGFAGAFGGVLAAALTVALCRTAEAPLGGLAAWMPVAIVLWAGLGAGLAALTTRWTPYAPEAEVKA